MGTIRLYQFGNIAFYAYLFKSYIGDYHEIKIDFETVR